MVVAGTGQGVKWNGTDVGPCPGWYWVPVHFVPSPPNHPSTHSLHSLPFVSFVPWSLLLPLHIRSYSSLVTTLSSYSLRPHVSLTFLPRGRTMWEQCEPREGGKCSERG